MSIVVYLIGIGAFLLILGLLSGFIVKKGKENSLIPNGKIVFNDLQGESYSLYSSIYPLIGKPDLVIKKGRKIIPIELKTGHHLHPRAHHVMQLIAYCQITTEYFHKSTPYGYIIYSDTCKRFKIPFDQNAKNRLKKSIEDMKMIRDQNKVIRNHHLRNKCNHCNLKNVCNQKINS